jgi:uncharacterized protein
MLAARPALGKAFRCCVNTHRSVSYCAVHGGTDDEIKQANQRYLGRVEIRNTTDHGWGVYAVSAFESGTVLFAGSALHVSSEQGSHTIQTAMTQHIVMDLPARFTNHACGSSANMGLKRSDRICTNGGTEAYDFVAKRQIAGNEELRWDYETTEYCLATPLRCLCGSPQCRGILKGFRYNAPQILTEQGREWVAPYLLETLEGKTN